MDDSMHLDAAFLLAGLRMPSYTLEQQVGEKRDGCGVYDLEPFHPFGRLATAAVRGKDFAVCGVQVTVYSLKYRFGTSLVGIRQRAATYFEGYAKMRQFTGLG